MNKPLISATILLFLGCASSATAPANSADSGSTLPVGGIVLSRAVNNGSSKIPSAGVSNDTGNGMDITFGDSAGITSPRLVVKYAKSVNTLAVALTSLDAARNAENYGIDPVVVPGNQAARVCLLSAATSSFPGCADLGIVFSSSAGTVSFKDTLMLAYPTGTNKLMMNGTGTFKPF
jgi:hypothetical protein